MSTQVPGNLTASRITTLPDGSVAEVVINERTEVFARWFDGSWSAWWPLAQGVRDVSIAPGVSGQEPAALISAVVFVRLPIGAIAPLHVAHPSAFYRVTADGVTAAADL